jgi:hypothetical protein
MAMTTEKASGSKGSQTYVDRIPKTIPPGFILYTTRCEQMLVAEKVGRV